VLQKVMRTHVDATGRDYNMKATRH
jgi:hypothetical protein